MGHPASQPPPSHAGPSLPLALPPDSEAALARGPASVPFRATPTSSASQGHSLPLSVLSASRRESWQLNHRKASSPSGVADKEGCINPRARLKCSLFSGSGCSQSHRPHQSPSAGADSLSAVDTPALGGRVVGGGIHLPPLDIRGHRDPDHQAIGNFSSAHDVSPRRVFISRSNLRPHP